MVSKLPCLALLDLSPLTTGQTQLCWPLIRDVKYQITLPVKLIVVTMIPQPGPSRLFLFQRVSQLLDLIKSAITVLYICCCFQIDAKLEQIKTAKKEVKDARSDAKHSKSEATKA